MIDPDELSSQSMAPLVDSEPVQASPSTHIPNLLHAALFIIITGVTLILTGAIVAAVTGKLDLDTVSSQRNLLFIEGIAYIVTLALSWLIFPLLWRRSFLDGVRWNARAVSPLLIGAGLLLGLLAQAAESFLPLPKNTPVEKLLSSDQLIWPLVILGTILAPVFEEIVFRGFLLPAFGYAAEWLMTVLGHRDGFALWTPATPTSRTATVLSCLLTSALFGAIHGPQLGSSVPAMLVLATISLVLCWVRLRFNSVAASTLVHASYNLSLFITLFLATGGFKHLDHLK